MSMDVPGWEEFPSYTAEVVSPELPCGAGWLGNCLLELGIPLWQPWDRPTNPLWQRVAQRGYRFIDRQDRISSWGQTLPALVAGRGFRFRDDIVPKFSHREKPLLPDHRPLILFVRDPRDALYSQWRRILVRENAAHLEFDKFLHQSFKGRAESCPGYLQRFLGNWQHQLARRPHLIIRFEQYKAGPATTLEGALAFLGADIAPEERKMALNASDFRVNKRIEEQRRGEGSLRKQLCRAGIPFEFRIRYTPAMLDSLGDGLDESCAWLGYANSTEARSMLKT